MDRYEVSFESLQKRKSEHYRILHIQFEEELALNKKQKRLERTKSRLDAKTKNIDAQLKEVESSELEIEFQTEKMKHKREYIKHLQQTFSLKETEFESRETELSELYQTEEEIGKQTTLHKQQINVIKKDARIEQQLAYIESS